MGYLKGWVAAFDAINLPLTSLFRDLPQVPLPEDPPIEEVPQRGQVRIEEDNPSFHELWKRLRLIIPLWMLLTWTIQTL